jgi:hypothetical protein
MEKGAPMRRIDARYEDEHTQANRVTGSLAGLAFALLLVVAGLVVVQHLASKARLEDCLLSGRLNCDVMVGGR